MFFHSTFDSKIINIIDQRDLCKSCGSNGISAKFVIFATYIIALYPTILCNDCLSFGLFPSSLKQSNSYILIWQ